MLTNTGEVTLDVDTSSSENIRGTDTAELENLRATDDTGSKNDLLVDLDARGRSAGRASILDASRFECVTLVKHNLGDGCVCQDLQVVALGQGVDECRTGE